jgi:hypothetical protein
MKFSARRTHVAGVAWPAVITDPWLISVRMIPTTIGIGIVRRWSRRSRQNAHAPRAALPRPRRVGWLREGAPVAGCRVGDYDRHGKSLTRGVPPACGPGGRIHPASAPAHAEAGRH